MRRGGSVYRRSGEEKRKLPALGDSPPSARSDRPRAAGRSAAGVSPPAPSALLRWTRSPRPPRRRTCARSAPARWRTRPRSMPGCGGRWTTSSWTACGSCRTRRPSATRPACSSAPATHRPTPSGNSSARSSGGSWLRYRARLAAARAPAARRAGALRARGQASAAGAARAAWPRSFRRSRRSPRHQAVADRPATPPGARDPSLGAKVAVLSPGVGASTPEWGQFRTLNWTLNAKSRPQCERRAAGRWAQNPRISRQNREWRGPESNWRHHDFQAVAAGVSMPQSHAVFGQRVAAAVPADSRRSAWV
jgi:hypothetical protein